MIDLVNKVSPSSRRLFPKILRRTLKRLMAIMPGKLRQKLVGRVPFSRLAPLLVAAVGGEEIVRWRELSIAIDPAETGGFLQYLLGAGGTPDEREIETLLLGLGSGAEGFFDVGANAGHIALAVARRLPHCHVYAFECNPHMVARLERNLELNPECGGRVTVVQAAVCDRAGIASFNPGSVSAPESGALASGAEGTITVETLSLDGFCAQRRIAPSAVKIDVEGAEHLVLDGMGTLLAAPLLRAVLIEVHGFAHQNAQAFTELILGKLKRHFRSIEYLRQGEFVPLTGDHRWGPREHFFARKSASA
jgi:FkbM family methyltransferase